jgi:hypothetical protein
MSGHQVEHGSPAWCAWAWDCLVQALHRLALPANQQATLKEMGHIPDELAPDFDHAWGLVSQLEDQHYAPELRKRVRYTRASRPAGARSCWPTIPQDPP